MSVLKRVCKNAEKEAGHDTLSEFMFGLSREHRLAPVSDDEPVDNIRKRKNKEKQMRRLVKSLRRK